MENKSWFGRAMPFIAVLCLQFGYAIMDVISKAAMNKGMSNYVYVVYRHAVAFFFITPFALYFDRKVRTKMTISIFIKIVALSLLEPVIDQNLYFLGMKYTTATFTTAMTNIIPAITFILACIIRLEKIEIRNIRSQAKIVGTLTTVGGAMVMTLIKGPVILNTFRGNSHNHDHSIRIHPQHTIAGSVMIVIGCFSWACFVNLQAITLRTYPAELSLTSLICLLGALEGSIVAMIMERGNHSVWCIKWDVKLLAIVYSGIVCSGIAYYLQGVVMKTKGPVFVTVFSPFTMMLVAIMGYFFLGEQMLLGRVIGAIVICLGMYLVVWGKSKDCYTPPRTIIQELILLDNQRDAAEKEHSTHDGVIPLNKENITNKEYCTNNEDVITVH